MPTKPYPAELATDVDYRGEKLHIRPVRPEDKALIVSEVSKRMTPEDLRLRFFSPLHEISPEMATRLYDLDYDRQMAFLLFKGEELEGLVRLVIEDGDEQAEFALTIASDRQRLGYGELLMRHVLDYARTRGIKRVVGHVLRENTGMLALVEQLGFVRTPGVSGSFDLRVLKEVGPL